MEVRLFPLENGKWTCLVMRTRRDENPTRIAQQVTRPSLRATVEQLAKEVNPPRLSLPQE